MVVFTIGCITGNVRTDVNSYKDPQCNETSIKKIMVFSTSKDMNYRELIEKQLVTYMKNKNYVCQAVRSIDILLPTRTYTLREIKAILAQHSIDTIFMFNVSDLGYKHG